MLLTILIQMDEQGVAFTARYKDKQSTTKGHALAGFIDGKPGTEWATAFPEKGVGHIINRIEHHTLERYKELSDNEAFKPETNTRRQSRNLTRKP